MREQPSIVCIVCRYYDVAQAEATGCSASVRLR